MKQSSKILSYISFSAFLVAGQLGVAQAAGAGNRGQLSSHDYTFVCAAATGGNAEVALSQIAVSKASDSSVKDFAQRMVSDHTKANQELTGLAQQKGATLPDAEPKKVERETEKLQNLSGNDFDKAYMKKMLADHEKTVKMFQKESEKGDDADLKSWVTKTLPTLQEHLSMAQSTETAVAAKP
jgi:putative membrane protein